jgi:nucleoside-diphosphate-sugar epimerase
MTRLFVTGGTGFLGSRVVAALRQRGISIVALDRSGKLREKFSSDPGVETIAADVLQPEHYRAGLAKTSVILHLAALTGRASEQEHFRVNAEGTEILLDEARRTGIRKILFVSSIAAKFPDKSRYYYAQAKVRAEEAVRASGLHFTTIRPTMIFGQGSPILSALQKLATLPVMPVFGNGRTLVQPIYVDDLVAYILEILDQDRFRGETLDLGGPAPVTIEELFQEIRQACKGSRGTTFHIPVVPLLPVLGAAESIGLGRVLPFSVGQLSSFRYDGTVTANSLHDERKASLRTVPEMLAVAPAESTTAEALQTECMIFTSYLLGCAPAAYVLGKYTDAHRVAPVFSDGSRFDRLLVKVAGLHPLLTKVADSYARIFVRTGLLRKKLVLLLAILETSSPSYELLDAVDRGGKPALLVRLFIKGVTFGVSLIAGAIVFLPMQMIFASGQRKTG